MSSMSGATARLLILLFTALSMPLAFAQGLAPEATMRKVTAEVLDALKGDPDIRAGDREKLAALVDAKVLAHFDFERMTALAMGRNWHKASAAQKQALAREFRALLVRTYSGAIFDSTDPSITFKPTRATAGYPEVTVRTQVRQGDGPPVSVDYGMEKSAAGWMVYDVVVEGISLVTNYRGTFDSEIRARGVDGLLRSLAEKNRASGTRAAPR